VREGAALPVGRFHRYKPYVAGVVIVLDADCRIDAKSLRALIACVAETGTPCQAVNLLAPDLGAGPLVQISSFAFMIKNLVRQRALQRLAGDVDSVVDALRPFVDVEIDPDRIGRPAVERLSGALGAAAGVPIVADAAERSYRHRATGSLGWPMLRWARRVRPDPLRRLHLEPATKAELPAATSLPESTAAQRAAVAMAARALAAKRKR